MRVFLTGATGAVGSAVAERLLAEGQQVVGLARSEESAAKLRKAGIEVHSGDLNDPDSLSEPIKSADGIIYSPAPSSSSDAEAAAQRTVTMMIDALAGSGKPLIFTSGVGVYGLPEMPNVDEDTPLTNVPASMVGRQQIEGLMLASVERGVRAIVLRPSFVYGRASHRLINGQIQQAKERGSAAYIGAGTNILPFIHTEDLAVAYSQALALAPAGMLINMVGSHVTARDFAIGVSYAAGVDGLVTSVEPKDAQATLGSGVFLFGQNMQISSARATSVLHWTPRAPSVLYELMYGSYRQFIADSSA